MVIGELFWDISIKCFKKIFYFQERDIILKKSIITQDLGKIKDSTQCSLVPMTRKLLPIDYIILQNWKLNLMFIYQQGSVKVVAEQQQNRKYLISQSIL